MDLGALSGRVLGRLVRQELVNASHWDLREIVGNYGRSGWWSDATLAHLFGAMFFSEMYIRFTAARLIEHCRRWVEAETHFRYAVAVLQEAAA
jgi:hypothetical protein